MKEPIRRARKLTRAKARESNLVYYNNGVTCSNDHLPIIRLTKTGGCYHCWRERREARMERSEQKQSFKVLYYLRFKRPDGTFNEQPIGPFVRRSTAVQRYKQMYRDHYGTECPTHFFGGADRAEDGNFEVDD